MACLLLLLLLLVVVMLVMLLLLLLLVMLVAAACCLLLLLPHLLGCCGGCGWPCGMGGAISMMQCLLQHCGVVDGRSSMCSVWQLSGACHLHRTWLVASGNQPRCQFVDPPRRGECLGQFAQAHYP
jgi:hypothetical protein